MNRSALSPTSGPIVPTAPAAPLPYRLARATLGRLIRLLYRVEVEGIEHLPDQGPVILAANHRSFMDSIFLALSSPRPISFMAKAEYFDHRLTRWLFTETGQIPVRRGSPAGARLALAAASDVLAHDGTIGAYPEGTRSRDGKLHRGHRGPALLAVETAAPIVPVGLIGTDAVQSPNQLLPRPFKTIRVRYGRPVAVSPDATGQSKAVRSRTLTDMVMHDIAELCGQPCDQHYARPPSANAA
jgi:1-acyl-sn-glycerol-3-phosphate acyltransferase